MTQKYRFTGDTEEVFPDLGVGVLQPGDEIELDDDPKHPRLKRVKPESKPEPKKEGN